MNKYRIVFFSKYAAESIFFAFLAVFFADEGFNGTEIGAILSFAPIILALSLPFFGKIDNGKTRKLLVITCSVLLIICEFVLFKSKSFVIIAIFTVFCSISRAPLNPSLDSVATLYAIENGKEYSAFRAFGSIGYIVTVFMGGFIYEWFGMLWLYIISAILFAVLAIYMFMLKPLKLDGLPKGPKEHNLRLLFTNKDFLIFLVFQIIFFAVMSFQNSYELLYLKSRNYPTSLFGVLSFIRVSLEVAAFYIIPKFKLPLKLVLVIAPLLILVQSIAYFINIIDITFYFLSVLSGLSSGIIIYQNNKYISKIVRPRNITVAIYIMVTVQNLSLALFLFAGGVVIDTIGINYIYLFSSIMFILSSIYALLLFKRKPKPLEDN